MCKFPSMCFLTLCNWQQIMPENFLKAHWPVNWVPHFGAIAAVLLMHPQELTLAELQTEDIQTLHGVPLLPIEQVRHLQLPPHRRVCRLCRIRLGTARHMHE